MDAEPRRDLGYRTQGRDSRDAPPPRQFEACRLGRLLCERGRCLGVAYRQMREEMPAGLRIAGSLRLTDQRSAKASFAPSARKAAAKLRRIQVMTRGRDRTCSRIAAANSP